MRFQAKSENDIRRESLMPVGEYGFEVIHAEDKQSKSGNDMIALKMLVYMPDGTQRHMRDWILEAFAMKLRHFCEATGLIDRYQAGTLCAADCMGRTGRVRVGINEDKSGDYPPSNKVIDYVVKGGDTFVPPPPTKPAEWEKSDAVKPDDTDLPF